MVAGAAIGIGSVELGYFLADLIFKERHLYDRFEKPCFFYDPSAKHYTAELIFGRRFIIGSTGLKDSGALPVRGSLAGVSVDVPFIPGLGLTGRASASSMTYADSYVGCIYSALAGGFYNLHFATILEFQVKALAGYAWSPNILAEAAHTANYRLGSGVSLGAGVSLSLITGNNFKVKAFAELESMDMDKRQPWLSTMVVGFGTGWFW